MSSFDKFEYKTLLKKSGLAGVALSFSAALVKHLIAKPGLRASADYKFKTALHLQDDFSVAQENVQRTADEIIRLFEEKGVKPLRIAIDGVPGSGKSTLTRELAQRLGMTAVCLDHQNMDEALSFDQERAIFEHHRLLRTQNIDVFDVVIYIDEPVAVSKKKVLARQRGGYLVDIMNYELLKQVGEKAFLFVAGDLFSVHNSFVKVKFKPQGGYKDRENINSALRMKGIDGSRYSKEEALFLCLGNDARKGFRAYVNLHAFDKEVIAALSESLFLAGKGRRSQRQ